MKVSVVEKELIITSSQASATHYEYIRQTCVCWTHVQNPVQNPKGPGVDTKFIEATLFTIPVNKLDVRIIKDVVLQENSTFLYKLPASLKEATLTSLDNFHSALQSVE